jgi:DNA-binding transcriptional LysR family regulator
VPALKELRSGAVDLVITEQASDVEKPRYPGLAVKPLGDDAYRIVAPSAWARDIRSIKDLVSRPWIAGEAGKPCGLALDRLAGKYGFKPGFVHRCIEYPSMLSMVAAGLGAAVVPVLALGSEPIGQIVVTRIPSGGFRRINAVYRATDHGPEPMILVLINALEEAAREKGLDPVPERARV